MKDLTDIKLIEQIPIVKSLLSSSNPTIITRGSFADWGESGKRKTNLFVTIYALYVLKCSGKLA